MLISLFKGGVIDLGENHDQAAQREITQKVVLTSKIINPHTLPLMISTDTIEVVRMYIALVWNHELDGERIDFAEEELKPIGFLILDELLITDRNNKTWISVTGGILTEPESLKLMIDFLWQSSHY